MSATSIQTVDIAITTSGAALTARSSGHDVPRNGHGGRDHRADDGEYGDGNANASTQDE